MGAGVRSRSSGSQTGCSGAPSSLKERKTTLSCLQNGVSTSTKSLYGVQNGVYDLKTGVYGSKTGLSATKNGMYGVKTDVSD